MLSDLALWLPVESEDHQIHQLEGQLLRQPAQKPVIGGWWKGELVMVTGILYGPPFLHRFLPWSQQAKRTWPRHKMVVLARP